MTISCDDTEWLTARLAASEAAIVAIEGALTALNTTGVQSYTYDSGQGRVTVTRADIARLRASLNEEENRRAVLRARLLGGATHMVPNY